MAAAYAAFAYESSLNVQRPTVLSVRTPEPPAGNGPASRVVWVLVDGLRLDASRRMTHLNRLRAEGVDVAARAEFPTFSGPNFVAQASGVEPAASGVLSNGYPGEVALDSVFRRAKLAGLRTAVLTTDPDPGLSRTYGSWVDETHIESPELHLPPAHLVFVHVGYVDWASHGAGSESREYRAAVARADHAIARIARSLDPTHEALVVTSDHGNLRDGGHGGTERPVMEVPIVVWGAGTAPRVRTSGRGRDVGPTIASLLGVGPLSHATGRPLVRSDAATSRQREAARAVVRAAGLLKVDYVPAVIPIAILVLVILGWGSGLPRRTLASAPTYALVFAGLLLVTGTTSFSVSNDSAFFGLRLTLLCGAAAFAQLRLGGRLSLVPASLVASLAVLATALVASNEPLAPLDGTLRFLPIPALTGLAFACLVTAAIGELPVGVRREGPAAELSYDSPIGVPLGAPAFVEQGISEEPWNDVTPRSHSQGPQT